jgi:hypothetical protein
MKRYLRLVLAGATIVAAVAAASKLGAQSAAATPIAQQFDALHYRSIGPASMSGRIADFAVYEANPSIFWVGTAHGGVWKTTNGGATFTGQFQQDGLMSIGAVAVSQKNANLVYLGTGEGTNRQSISWGSGMYKSTDGGTKWTFIGLGKSYHIQRLAVDPDNDQVVFVAAQGALFGPGGDRGVYKTTDGGATWKQVLKVDDDTGANDIVMSASDHKILYASTYQRRRSQCCMNGGGPGSGIWKSTDGGDTWTKLSGGGLPGGSLGRIGLDVYRRSANIVYATIEAEAAGGGGGGRGGGGGGAAGGGAGGGDAGVYRTDDGGTTWRKVNGNNPRPMYFSQIRVDPNNPDRTILGGVRMTISLDGGKTQLSADPAVHDDKHALWWDPNNSDHILIGTDGGAYASWDMTRSWIWFPNIPVGLFYHVGFDMEYPYNVCGGMQDNYDWCGPSAVRTANGISNDRWQSIQGGDGFVAIPDQRDGRIVYSETQDGNTMRHNRVTGEAKSIRPSPQNVVNAQVGGPNCDPPAPGGGGRGGGGPCAAYRFNWDTPMVFSPTDPGVLYIAGNHIFRSTDRGDSWTAVSPDLTSNANRDDVVTMGLKGSDVRISKNDGIVAWPTVVSFAESAKQPGLYYAGTDDGTVSVSKDAGKTWDKTLADRMSGFVKGAWVSKVMPSRYDAGTVYIASDAHRLNDYETHMWVSHDFGATFQSLNGNLKGEAIKTMTEDQRNQDVLYAGGETGLFVSLDRGKSWSRLRSNFPDVRVDEITLHPRDNAMLLATHGRALWILDHLSPIQEYTAAQGTDAHLFSIDPALQWRSFDDKNDEFWGHQFFVGENPPTQAIIQYFLKAKANDVKLKIADATGKEVRTLTLAGTRLSPGIQTACWDTRVEAIAPPAGAGAAPAGGGGRGAGGGGRGGGGGIALPQPEPGYSADNPCGGPGGGGGGGGRGGGSSPQGPYVLPGTYNVTLIVDGKTYETKPMKVVLDPEQQMTDVQRKKYFDTVMDLHDMQRRGEEMAAALTPLSSQMNDVAEKLKTANNVPAATKGQFDALQKEFDGLKTKFGVSANAAAAAAAPAAGGGRGGRGGRGGAAPAGQAGAGAGRGAAGGGAGAAGGGAGAAGDPAAADAAAQGAGAGGGGFGFGGGAPASPDDLVAKAGALKGQMMSFSEVPSETLMKQYNDVKVALPKAITDANAFLVKAMTVSQALKKYDVALTVPAPVK